MNQFLPPDSKGVRKRFCTMKTALTLSIPLCALFIFVAQVSAMNRNFRGSSQEVEQELYAIFPVGTLKDDVLNTASAELNVDRSEIVFSPDYLDKPRATEVHGQTIHVHSWVKMQVAEYRSIRQFFMKTTVVATFLFDEKERLAAIEVELFTDSL